MNIPTKEFTQSCKDAEFFETPDWVVERILDVELMTPVIVDPCAGRGVLGRAARARGYRTVETDLNDWPGQPDSVLRPMDFLKLSRAGLVGNGEFSVLMNPPFSLAVEFVQHSLELGARKVVMFQRLAFLESSRRREFFEELPPARIWLCGDRATCWRGDIPEEDVVDAAGEVLFKGKKGRSAPTPHAFYVWEAGHVGSMNLHHLYRS